MSFRDPDATYLDDSLPLSPRLPFTRADARRAGLTRELLGDLCERRLVKRVLHGVYVDASVEDSLDLRVKCLAAVAPPDCVVVDRHAGWLHGAEMILAPGEHISLRPVSLFRPSDHGRVRTELAASGERNLIESDITEIAGIAVTTRLRTTWDLGRQRRRDHAFAGMCSMARLGGIDLEEMRDGIGRFRGMRWVTRLTEFAPLARPEYESPGECGLALVWKDAGLPPAVPQYEFFEGGRAIYRADLANEELRLVGEYLGREWHHTNAQRANDATRTAWLESHGARWRVEEFVAHDVYHPTGDAYARLTRAARELGSKRRHVA